ncbi:MAG: YtxH domain-containing protein [Candidatus Latescibacteria bacterium]|mgnify:CR=1 FL=1|jgi:gas vesicle protein|nr:YtxH domain-containing protein [Candidatus Latescibacterota bacterium]
MIWIRREQRDFFWVGFWTGAVIGGAVGAFVASEMGKRAYERLEAATQDVRNRFDGRLGRQEEQVEAPASEEDVPAESASAEDDRSEDPT